MNCVITLRLYDFLVPPPMPYADEGGYKVICIKSERSIQPFTEEHIHSCQTCKDADNPHEVLLSDLQNDINHSGDEGKYFKSFIHSLRSVAMTD